MNRANRLSNEMAVAGWTTYQLRRQLLAIGEDFWVQNVQGENIYKLDGKVLTLAQTFALEDVNGNELVRMQAEMLKHGSARASAVGHVPTVRPDGAPQFTRCRFYGFRGPGLS
ncbi:MAG: hypothetical protein PVS3B2_06700 [Candidatus Dormibacteraceae bacterium]